MSFLKQWIEAQTPEPRAQVPIDEELQARLTLLKKLLPEKVFVGFYNQQVLAESTEDGSWIIALTNELEARAWIETVHADAVLEVDDLRTVIEGAVTSNTKGVLIYPESDSPLFFSTSDYQLILNEPGGKFAHLLDNQVYVVVQSQGSTSTLCTRQLPEGRLLVPVFEEGSWGVEWILQNGVPGVDTLERMTLREACNQALSHPSEIYFLWLYFTPDRHRDIRLSEYQQVLQLQSQDQMQPPEQDSPESANKTLEGENDDKPNPADLLLDGEEKAMVERLLPLPDRRDPEKSLAKLYEILLRHAVLVVVKKLSAEEQEAAARKEEGTTWYETRNLVYFKHPKSGNRFLTIFSSMDKAMSFLAQLSPEEEKKFELIPYPFASFCKRADGTVSYVTVDIGNEAHLLIRDLDLTHLAKGQIPSYLLV